MPEAHLAYCISDSIDSLDLSAFHARYGAGGARNHNVQLVAPDGTRAPNKP